MPPRITLLDRTLFKEMVPIFGITLVFFTFIFLMTSLLEIMNLIINYRVKLVVVLKMMAFSMPFFLEFIIPMSVMMAVLMTFLRMSGDNEIIALKSSGMSLYRLIPPVAVFCSAGVLMTAAMAIYALPWGKASFKQTLLEIGSSNFDIGLKERTFIDSFQGVMLYVSRMDLKNRELQDIFIEDQRSRDIVSTIVAPRGRLFRSSEGTSGHLRLYDGLIHTVDHAKRTVHAIRFETYDFRLDLREVMTTVQRGPKDKEEMSLVELRRYIDTASQKDARYYSALIEYHEKFAIPAACLALGLLAIPLGLQPMAGRRSIGLVLGLFFFMLYYLMLIIGWAFGESGVYPPAIGMWVPNLITAGAGLYLLVRTAAERPIRIDSLVVGVRRLWRRTAGRRLAGREE